MLELNIPLYERLNMQIPYFKGHDHTGEHTDELDEAIEEINDSVYLLHVVSGFYKKVVLFMAVGLVILFFRKFGEITPLWLFAQTVWTGFLVLVAVFFTRFLATKVMDKLDKAHQNLRALWHSVDPLFDDKDDAMKPIIDNYRENLLKGKLPESRWFSLI